MSVENGQSKVRRHALTVLSCITLTGSAYFLKAVVFKNPYEHPDNNTPLGTKFTTRSKYGYRARLMTTEERIDSSELVHVHSEIKSGDDILKVFSKTAFGGGSGILLKGSERFLGFPYNAPRLAVADPEGVYINYQLPPLSPGLQLIIEKASQANLITVINYTHPEIELDIAFRPVLKEDPDLKFAPVIPFIP